MDVGATFGSNVKRFRQALGLTQAALAEKLGVTLQTVFNYEAGTKWPRPDMIAALSNVLGVPPSQLLATEELSQGSPEDALRSLAKHFGYRLVRA